MFYADGERIQTLLEHVNGVSSLAEKYAVTANSPGWGKLAGNWHDLGKYSQAFQKYMLEDGPKVEHAVVGARYASQFTDALHRLALQIVITCHHTGLQNPQHIAKRVTNATQLLGEALSNVPAELLDKRLPALPEWINPQSDKAAEYRTLEFWIRILHSCLVDADWLDAEKRNINISQRPSFLSTEVLRNKLDIHIDEIIATAKDENWTDVNRQREIVLQACRKAAVLKPGFFSLTVPTGGGKTLSAMSFALNHVVENELDRVVVVIPFTSIISQNAKEYADIFGRENVVEHHSSFTPKDEMVRRRNQLASENWDAPIIVTTNVQFFETLFANKNSKLRKLHNVVKSVIILDEVQSLPPGLLYPILEGLKELQAHYGCTIVLSTATQPALEKSNSLMIGLENVHEIIPDTISLARDLTRVQVEWDIDVVTEYIDIANRIRKESYSRALVVTHKRNDARELTRLLPQGCYHLSASMCPAHRQETIDAVKDQLKEQESSVHLVSTQLIEAGVDIDFPVVFRALAGLDSLSQTAGRCNREGKADSGLFVIFRAPTKAPAGILLRGIDKTESLLNSGDIAGVVRGADGNPDLMVPKNYQTYFKLFYFGEKKDGAGVQTYREKLDYPEVAKRFKLIDNETFPVVVPYGGAYDLLEGILQKDEPSRDDFRELQPFVVQIYEHEFSRLDEVGAIASIQGKSFYYLTVPYERVYAEKFGLLITDENLYPDESRLIL